MNQTPTKRKMRLTSSKWSLAMIRILAHLGIIPLMAEFVKTRNQALLDAGMGMGEYYFIYVVVYYPWLGKSRK